MAFDEELANRVRTLLDVRVDVNEKRMFGGIAFLVAGNMCCGINGDELIVRLDPGEAEEFVKSEPGARPMDMTGKPLRGWLFVAADATAEDADLEVWVRRAAEYASRLPPK